MKTKNNDTRRVLLLQLLEAVNSKEEFDYIQSELAALVARSLAPEMPC